MTGALLRVGAGSALVAGTTWLLRRMGSDFARRGRFGSSTTALVYAGYVVQLGAMVLLMVRPDHRLPIRPPVAQALGGTLASVGLITFAAGARSFGSAGQLSGIETGRLITGGIYRWSANPQYLGYLSVLGGASLASRSTDAALATAAFTAVFDHWIGHEEANLTRVFGDDYRRFRRRTPRWISIPTSGPRL